METEIEYQEQKTLEELRISGTFGLSMMDCVIRVPKKGLRKSRLLIAMYVSGYKATCCRSDGYCPESRYREGSEGICRISLWCYKGYYARGQGGR